MTIISANGAGTNNKSQASTASKTLETLLIEDPQLRNFNLTNLSQKNEPSFAYAASLINVNNNVDALYENDPASSSASMDWADSSIAAEIQEKAKNALAEVERKLVLVESLSERISREKPEHVAAPLLKLHGFSPFPEESDSSILEGDVRNSATLTSTLERCDRLARQSQVLDSVANRVESTLARGLDRMTSATGKLERVLKTSQVLKMVMRLKFEAKKVSGSGLDFKDLRDLTRAAASVAVMEELLNHEDLKDRGIDIVEKLRPEAERIAKAVRKAAAGLLAEQHKGSSSSSGIGRLPSATKLGATLQVYYHLGELPDAAWKSVCLGLERAENASGQFFNPSAIKRLMDSAKSEAKIVADNETMNSDNKRQKEIAYERALKTKIREKKAEAASNWASGIAEAALQVFNLHRVLMRKADPVTRQNFLEVVNAAPVPEEFKQAQELIEMATTKGNADKTQKQISIFSLFWNQMCISLGARMQRLLKYENGSILSDVASFYPSVRAAALEMLSSIQDTMQAGALSSSVGLHEEAGSGVSGGGIMGGSSALDDAVFFGFSQTTTNADSEMALGGVSADSWTKKETASTSSGFENKFGSRTGGKNHIQTSSVVVSSILSSPEWKSLQGSGDIGLYPMQRAFMIALKKRLQAPLSSLFVENRVVDENGIDIKMLPSLPSDQDLKQLETLLRTELSLADPREGGGEFSMTTMISECIVDTVETICSLARGATSGTSEENLIHKSKGTATEGLNHDMKVAGVLATLTNHLRSLPENTFVVPYRPAHSLQHEEAANMCQIALLPAIHEIESMVKNELVNPLCKVLNKGIASEISKMHRGAYMDSDSVTQGSFVQDYLARKYDDIAVNILTRLPGEYGGMIASTICTFSIYCFVSNASLIRPLGEMGRLRITQDLADFELTLEQLIFKGGGTTPLNQIGNGKPYAELRAVRQMLFWSGLENKSLSSEQVSKTFFREVWVKDVRPSTAFHFLFTFAPALLSSPHHASRMSAEEYVGNLVQFDGSVDDGEAKAWMTTMNCCDAYQQRDSIDGGASVGDRRVPAILMIIGPELLRRRRY